MNTFEKQVETLANKAAASDDKDDAMRFAQASLNVAHAAQVLETIKRDAK